MSAYCCKERITVKREFYVCRTCAYLLAEPSPFCPGCGDVSATRYKKQVVVYRKTRKSSIRIKVVDTLLPHLQELKEARDAGVTVTALAERFGELVTAFRLREFLLDFGILQPYTNLRLKRSTYHNILNKRDPLDGSTYLMLKKDAPPHVLVPLEEYQAMKEKANRYDSEKGNKNAS